MGRGSENERPFLDRTLRVDDATGASLQAHISQWQTTAAATTPRKAPQGLKPLTEVEIEHLWMRYEEAADEGRIGANRRFETDITPREFRRVLFEIELLRSLLNSEVSDTPE